MVNLLEETERRIPSYLTVTWVGSADGKYSITWDQFKYLAKDLEYDNGYGGQEIASDLVVVLSDGSWLVRHEYDGSEEWRRVKVPIMQPGSYPIMYLVKEDSTWETLEQMNG